ncbi:hypothetical protein CCP3SC15_1420003 [Gammaproteobacteria bacterium]
MVGKNAIPGIRYYIIDLYSEIQFYLPTSSERECDYAIEVVPTKAAMTQDSNYSAIRRLTAVFGAMPITSIRPQMIYQYVDKRSVKTKGEDGRVTGGKISAHKGNRGAFPRIYKSSTMGISGSASIQKRSEARRREAPLALHRGLGVS